MDPRSGASQPPTDECLKNIEVMSQPESFRTRQPVNMSKDNGAIVCLLVAIFDHCVVAAAVALWTRKIVPRQKNLPFKILTSQLDKLDGNNQMA